MSSFGVGGTISHLIVEQGDPVRPADPDDSPGPWVFPVSSASPDGVAAQAAKMAGWLDEHPDVPLSRVAGTLALRRSHLPFRRAVVAADKTPGRLVS